MRPDKPLILFDLDGTLVLSDGAGMRAIRRAAQELYGRPVETERIPFAGSLDPLIFASLCELNDIAPGPGDHDRFRALYVREFGRELEGGAVIRALEGVHALLAELDGFDLGALSGNYPETGRMKLEAAGIAPELLPVQAWGSDAPTRPELVRIALARYVEHHGREVAAERALIVGDTPHDIECARANGCPCIAVATGRYSYDELAALSPSLTLESLADPRPFLAFLRAL